MESVSFILPGVRQDSRGDDVDDWDNPASTTTVTALGVEPVSSTEDNDGRQAVITGLRIYLPAGTSAPANARAVVRGETWERVGDAADWRSPFTAWTPGLVVSVRKVVG